MRTPSANYALPGTLGAIDALSEILSGVKRDVARSREVLNGAFGKIAARFAQVHAIAVAAEARDQGLSDEALRALRKVTDGLTIELIQPNDHPPARSMLPVRTMIMSWRTLLSVPNRCVHVPVLP